MENINSYCFSTFYKRYRAGLEQYLYNRIKIQEVAADIAQDTFIKLLEYCKNGGECNYPKSFLYRTALNLTTDYYRKRNKDVPCSADDYIPRSENINNAFLECVLRAIDSLPFPYKECVRMADIDQIPQKLISKKLHLSMSGARSRIQRGRIKLYQWLSEQYDIEKDAFGNILYCEPKAKKKTN